MNGQFFNKMPFPVNMRKTWEPGCPAIRLESGAIVEGPADILSQFKFLGQMPSDFCNVDSITQTQDRQFIDNGEKTHVDIPVVETTITEEKTADNSVVENTETNGLPFDPKNVNWLHIKVAELEAACKILNVDMDSVAGLKPKEKKWALVKLVKKACGIEVK